MPGQPSGLADVVDPKVTKIITIGWKGAERHFLKLLAQGLVGSQLGVDVVTVAGTAGDAEATLRQILNFRFASGPWAALLGFLTALRSAASMTCSDCRPAATTHVRSTVRPYL